MPIMKGQILVTVMWDTDDMANPCVELTPSEVLNEMDDGFIIGTHEYLGSKPINPDHVELELQRIGNDGTFFDKFFDIRD